MDKNKFADLYTPEGENLPEIPWNTYPRPTMKRDSFFCLNGEWEFCTAGTSVIPGFFGEKITVPFPPQSLLSGIHRDIPEKNYLFYKKTFSFPEDFNRGKVILHFGAVDQYATVWLNGKIIGEHESGYEHFSFDITNMIKKENVLIVKVKDEMSSFVLPYGKQSAKRGGMWYTPVSGIWQTVWIESVPEKHITSVNINTGKDFAEFTIEGVSEGEISVKTSKKIIKESFYDGKAKIEFKNPKIWSPKHPYLYECEITAGEDKIETYFALRTLSIEEFNGIPRLCLNGKPYFFHGLLDQGYWSDGIFTPASPSCYEKDILAAKSLGFNTLRKHIKIEPEQFYYDCDRLGMIVFQDMVNNGDYSFFRDTALPTVGFKKKNDKNLHRNKKTRTAFLKAMEQTVAQLKNHPSICYWTIFNEAWGQFDSAACYRQLKALDCSRFIDSTSGWFRGSVSDVESLHIYFDMWHRLKKSDKPIVLSEFGGFTYAAPGHIWNTENTYGYGACKSPEALTEKLRHIYETRILPAVKKGLCASIYTQISDVEDEINGLLTYDRKLCKPDAAPLLAIAKALQEALR